MAALELRELALQGEALYGRSPEAALRFGYRAGAAAVLAVWVMWDCVEVVDSVHKHTSHDSVAAKAAWPVFRVCGVLLAWHWLWAVWKSTAGLGGPDQTSEFSSSIKSKSIRLIFGRIDCSRRVLEAKPKRLRRNCRVRSH